MKKHLGLWMLIMILIIIFTTFVFKKELFDNLFSKYLYRPFIEKLNIPISNNFTTRIGMFNMIQAISFTLLSTLVLFIQWYIIAKSLAIPISLFFTFAIMSISRLFSFLPISFSGIGTRDAALIFLFSLLGLDNELAVAYSLLIFIIIYLFNGFFGFVTWLLRPINIENNLPHSHET